jgi:hypothetical protein
MKKGSSVGVLPDRTEMSLTDDELHLAHGLAYSLMRAGIPAAVDYAGSGVKYDGQGNFVERRVSVTWLSCKGEAVVTATRSETEFTQPQLQVLANGIAHQYQTHMQSQFPKEAADVVPITQGAANDSGDSAASPA